MKMITAKITAKGRVQGVGFRYFVQNSARPLNITGYTMNLPNGDVETVAQGPEDRIQRLIQFIKEGSMLSRVDEVEVEYYDYHEEYKSFDIKK